MRSNQWLERLSQVVCGHKTPHGRLTGELADSNGKQITNGDQFSADPSMKGRYSMTLTTRKWLVGSVVMAILVLAGVYSIVSWLDGLGLVRWAEAVRDEYLPGSTLTIVVALLVLVGAPTGCFAIRRCRVCQRVALRPGKYCSACGSRT